MVALAWPAKDPDEVLDYQLDWSLRVLDDTIQSSEWTMPEGLEKVNDFHNASTTTVWLRGGTLDETHIVLNRIVTNGGRTMDQSVKLKIKSK
jgi:hypothetical protein